MKLRITHPYLVFPVNTEKSIKRLLISAGDTLVFDLCMRFDAISPNFNAYIDVRRFMGRELDISFDPYVTPVFHEADEKEQRNSIKESFRPRYHFTAPDGWLNDPNGLVCDAEGTYHLFYQHNPTDPLWYNTNMHWGHATSRDLIHWTDRPIALFPDETGTMYSGCGLLDKDGIAGFGKNALLFYYTASGGKNRTSGNKKYTQCLAYSTDNGKTFEKYSGNPVIPHIINFNRDPKIVFCEELNCHILCLFLDSDIFALFTTNDLIHFEKLQELTIDGDSECPDFYPMTADDGTHHWIFSGAHGKYLVGNFKDGKFVAEQSVRNLHPGSKGYAAQTFSDTPDGRRIYVAWETLKNIPGMPFTSQMSLPSVHTLKLRKDGYAICPMPIKEAELLRKSPIEISDTEDGFISEVSGTAVELDISLPTVGKDVTMLLLGQQFTFDRTLKELRMNKTLKVPLEEENGKFSVRMFFDVCSVEIFSGGYETCFESVMDDNLNKIVLTGDNKAILQGWNLENT